MDHINGVELDVPLKPRSLEEALNEMEAASVANQLNEKGVEFDLDDRHIFKLDGASLTITSK